MEVTLKYRQFHRFINRGFLTGPWLPIYGSGAVLITVIVGGLTHYDSSYAATFVASFIICGIVEYMASYILEKRYHARWWDYSRKPMNLHGRVWIGNLILFGLGGVAIIHIVNPLLYRLFDNLGTAASQVLAGSLSVVFASDFVVSCFVMKLVKTGVESSEADNTEEVSAEVRHLLSDRSYFYRRFADAYPEVVYRTERINARMEAIRRESERIRAEAAQRLENMNSRVEAGREYLSDALESTVSIQNQVISRQEELIALLYDESEATDEMKSLRDTIRTDMGRLEKRRILRKREKGTMRV